MKKWIAITAYVGVTLAVSGGLLAFVLNEHGSTPTPDIAAQVREVFSAKCAMCHGPDVSKPEGRFGYVLNLGRIAENPEMVIPGKPEESELWVLVKRGEMPPPEASDGPLSEQEKGVIRAWIEAGAPAQAASAKNAPSQRPLR